MADLTSKVSKYEEELNNIAFKNISDFGWVMIIEGIRMTESPYLMEKAWKYIDVIADKIIKQVTKAKALVKQSNSQQILKYSNTEIIELMKSLRVIHEVKMVYYAISGECNEYRELEDKYHLQNSQKQQTETEEEPIKKTEKKPIEQYYDTIIKLMHNILDAKAIELKTNFDKNIKTKIVRIKGKQVIKEGTNSVIDNLREQNEELMKAIEQFQMAIIEKDTELVQTRKELDKLKESANQRNRSVIMSQQSPSPVSSIEFQQTSTPSQGMSDEGNEHDEYQDDDQ